MTKFASAAAARSWASHLMMRPFLPLMSCSGLAGGPSCHRSSPVLSSLSDRQPARSMATSRGTAPASVAAKMVSGCFSPKALIAAAAARRACGTARSATSASCHSAHIIVSRMMMMIQFTVSRHRVAKHTDLVGAWLLTRQDSAAAAAALWLPSARLVMHQAACTAGLCLSSRQDSSDWHLRFAAKIWCHGDNIGLGLHCNTTNQSPCHLWNNASELQQQCTGPMQEQSRSVTNLCSLVSDSMAARCTMQPASVIWSHALALSPS